MAIVAAAKGLSLQLHWMLRALPLAMVHPADGIMLEYSQSSWAEVQRIDRRCPDVHHLAHRVSDIDIGTN
jgi:hypothetical protein